MAELSSWQIISSIIAIGMLLEVGRCGVKGLVDLIIHCWKSFKELKGLE